MSTEQALAAFLTGTPMHYDAACGTRYVATFHPAAPVSWMDVRRADGQMFKTPNQRGGETARQWQPIMSRIDAENCFRSTFGDPNARAKLEAAAYA